MEKVFVYGTLRPPQADTPDADSRYYFEVRSHIESTQPAWMHRADLYNIGAYPAARPGQATIYGDLLTLAPHALAITDRIEGHPRFFFRERVEVQTATGLSRAWIYWAPRSLTIGMRRIPCGDWFKRDKQECRPLVDEPAEVEAPADENLLAVIKHFAEAECCWLSTVRPTEQAHSAPVWHVWQGGRIYVVTQPGSVKMRNISSNPSVVVTHPDPFNPIIIEGWATLAPDRLTDLRPLFLAKYSWDIATDQAYSAIIEITPTKVLAWGSHGEGRWSGEAALRVRAIPPQP
ncbi:MAG TPA: gamma-glutamylcyclotransferase [Anaerolineae bacterium]|nr:gamma-glutamylcyclotransferase [Anaerolineae bacterium]HMR63129.1 gamma-glutamylcyclotransferase [Anaerolineae bacterium]